MVYFHGVTSLRELTPFDSTETRMVTVKNEALSNERMSFVNKNPGRIVCLIWGEKSVLRYVTIPSAQEKVIPVSQREI